MSEVKWTPGPWTLKIGQPSMQITQWPSGKKWQAGSCNIAPIELHMSWSDYTERGKARDVANAHLIAAAPALYEALGEAGQYIDGHRSMPVGIRDRIAAALRQACGE